MSRQQLQLQRQRQQESFKIKLEDNDVAIVIDHQDNTQTLSKSLKWCDLCESLDHNSKTCELDPMNIKTRIMNILEDGNVKTFNIILTYFESFDIQKANYFKDMNGAKCSRVRSVLFDMVENNILCIGTKIIPNEINRVSIDGSSVSDPERCRLYLQHLALIESKCNPNHREHDHKDVYFWMCNKSNTNSNANSNVMSACAEIKDNHSDQSQKSFDPILKQAVELMPIHEQIIEQTSEQIVESTPERILLDPNSIVYNDNNIHDTNVIMFATKIILALEKIRSLNRCPTHFIVTNIVVLCKRCFTADGFDSSTPKLAALIDSLQYNCNAYLNENINKTTTIGLSNLANNVMIDIHCLYNYDCEHKSDTYKFKNQCLKIFNKIIEFINI